MLPMISGFKFWGEDLLIRFPRIVSRGITFPLDKVFQLASSAKESMSRNGLDLELLFPLFHDGWRAVIVGPVFLCFTIGSQQRRVKDVMDGPGQGKLELISNR
jgi:hypothetical protein